MLVNSVRRNIGSLSVVELVPCTQDISPALANSTPLWVILLNFISPVRTQAMVFFSEV